MSTNSTTPVLRDVPNDQQTSNSGTTTVDNPLKIESSVFNSLIQDKGFSEELQNPPVPKKGQFVQNNIVYPQLTNLATQILDRVKENRDKCFPRFMAKNPSQTKKTIAKWLILMRKQDDNNGNLHVLNQDAIHTKAKNIWGPIASSQLATVNDCIRIFGILTNASMIDDMNVLLGNRAEDVSGAPRDRIDNPSNQKRNIFAKVAILFNDPNTVISNPPSWHQCHEYNGYADINGNQKERIKLGRDSKFVADQFKNTLKTYRVASKKYKSDTGGGSGSEHRFVTWDEREDKTFYKYSNSQGLLLTWIFMHDRRRGFILDARPTRIPDDCAIDGNATASLSPSRKSSASSELNAAIKGVCATIDAQKEFQNKLIMALDQDKDSGNSGNESMHEQMEIIRGLKDTGDMLKDLEKVPEGFVEDTESAIAERQHREEKRSTIHALERALMKRARTHISE